VRTLPAPSADVVGAAARAAAVAGLEPHNEDRTRDRVARSILEQGPSTAADLAERLGLTPAAVRRHLDALLAAGHVQPREARVSGPRGRGRPAKAFALTDAGHAAMTTAYDDLAASALRFLAEIGGPEAVERFAQERVAELERRYRPIVEAAGPDVHERADRLAGALSADGYAASTRSAALPGSAGIQVCQGHCPVQHVAAEFPQLCEAETEVFGRLLGAQVRRLATLAHGEHVCTTHVSDPAHLTSASSVTTTRRASS
jgi:predicted ArsR family transcriptional regulator